MNYLDSPKKKGKVWSELSWEGYAHLYASLPRCVPCSTLGTTAEDCTSLFFLFVFQIWFVVLYLSSHKSVLNIGPASGLRRKTIELHLCACTRETPQDLAALVTILYAIYARELQVVSCSACAFHLQHATSCLLTFAFIQARGSFLAVVSLKQSVRTDVNREADVHAVPSKPCFNWTEDNLPI